MIFHQLSNSKTNYNYNAVFYKDQFWDYHFHRNFELICVLKGSVICTINDVEYTLSEGEFGLCLPYDIHKYAPNKNSEYWVMVFSEEFVRYFAQKINGKSGNGFVFKLDDNEKAYFTDKLIYCDSPTPMLMKSCLYLICEEYIKQIPLVDKRQSEVKIMPILADYIKEHHAKNITLTDIAKKLGYDYNYMSRYFKKVFNMTFSDFVNIYRLETAIKLLEETNKSITDIVYESGFQSIRTFNSFFKNKMGMSPTQYKNTIRK